MPIHAFTFPEWKEISKCRKCGMEGPAITSEFCDGTQNNVVRPLCAHIVGEHMHRRCARCSFQWFERPLDTQPPPGNTVNNS